MRTRLLTAGAPFRRASRPATRQVTIGAIANQETICLSHRMASAGQETRSTTKSGATLTRTTCEAVSIIKKNPEKHQPGQRPLGHSPRSMPRPSGRRPIRSCLQTEVALTFSRFWITVSYSQTAAVCKPPGNRCSRSSRSRGTSQGMICGLSVLYRSIKHGPAAPPHRYLDLAGNYFICGLQRQYFRVAAASATRHNAGRLLRESHIPVPLCVCSR
jgi:hypothetical protein